MDLLTMAGDRLAAGDMGDALAFLQGEPDVKTAFGDDLAITFQVDGAPPTWLVDHSGLVGDAARSESDPGPALADIRLASVVGEDTTGDGHVDQSDAKRALVLAPYMWQFSPNDESDLLASSLEAMPGYEGNVTLRANRVKGDQNITVDDWIALDDYDAIFMSTHGQRVCGRLDGQSVCRTIIHTGIDMEQSDRTDSRYSGFYPIGLSRNDSTNLDLELGVTLDFFKLRFPDGLDDLFLSLSACETGLIAGDELAAAIDPDGDDVVVMAWTEAVPSGASFDASLAMIEQLSLGLTTEQAYQAVIDTGQASAVNPAGMIAALEHISPGDHEVRLVELPTLKIPDGPIPGVPDFGSLITGTPGDGRADTLTLDLGLVGIDDPARYGVRYEVNGRPTGRTYRLTSATPSDLPYAYDVRHVVDVEGGLPVGDVELAVIVDLPEGGESRYTVRTTLDAADARITIGGQAWDFVLADGFFGCNVSADGSELNASGSVDGAFEITFSAFLHPFGVGTRERLVADNIASLMVTDDTNHQIWVADATDPNGYSAALEAIPGGSSQIDTLTIEGNHAWGSATFIERNAVFDAWSAHGPLPAPVVGTFDIRCPGA